MSFPAYLPSKTHAVNLLYKIPTDDFVCGALSSNLWPYSADFPVEEQPDYPELPPSVWTVTLSVGDDNGKISASVRPKESNAGLKSVSSITVETRVRMSGYGVFYDLHIGPNGWGASAIPANTTSDPLSGMSIAYRSFCGNYHYQLRKGMAVHVNLTFYVEKKVELSKERLCFKNLLDSHMLADCTLICGGQEFPAHRAILAAQSPVFAAMFQNEMSEKTTGVCKIEDVSRDALGAILSFAYGAPVEAGEKLEEIWIAADKYDMENLRSECEQLLVASITVDNAVKHLCFGREHGLKKLQKAAVKFIGQYAVEIN